MAKRYLKFVVLIFAALSASTAVQGATYRWVDDKGVMHFTDNGDSIPERYLNRAKEIEVSGGESRREAVLPSAAPAAASPVAPTAQAAVDSGSREQKRAKQEEHARLSLELKEIREALPAKKQELERLHHKWVVSKGRMPTGEELKDFEKKRAKGKATFKDNPYINKKPLSSPGIARA